MNDHFTKIGSGQLQGKHSKKERQHRLYKQVHRRFVIVYSFHGAKNAYVLRHFTFEKSPFYQDRLGTKALKNRVVAPFYAGHRDALRRP
jgi:hypothetical protein